MLRSLPAAGGSWRAEKITRGGEIAGGYQPARQPGRRAEMGRILLEHFGEDRHGALDVPVGQRCLGIHERRLGIVAQGAHEPFEKALDLSLRERPREAVDRLPSIEGVDRRYGAHSQPARDLGMRVDVHGGEAELSTSSLRRALQSCLDTFAALAALRQEMYDHRPPLRLDEHIAREALGRHGFHRARRLPRIDRAERSQVYHDRRNPSASFKREDGSLPVGAQPGQPERCIRL